MTGAWSEEIVGGHPCDVFAPSRMNQHGFVVLYLHGVHFRRLVDKPAFVERFEHHGLPVVAPLTGRSWWTDRICLQFDPQVTAQQHVLERVMPFLAERFASGPKRVGLLGTGMGGQGALRLAYRFPETFPVVAAISPAIDYHLRINEGDETLGQMYEDAEQARQDTATLHVHPLNWPRHQFFCCDPTDDRWWDSADRLRMKLYSLGVPHQCDLTTEAGGHGLEYYSAMAEPALDFLVESLQRERRRLV